MSNRMSLFGLFCGTLSVCGLASAQDSYQGHPRNEVDIESRSSPIAITGDDRFVWSVNPDNNSVSVFRVANDVNRKLAEIAVGKEPWCVAIQPEAENDDRYDRDRKHEHEAGAAKVYVTNMVSGTVS